MSIDLKEIVRSNLCKKSFHIHSEYDKERWDDIGSFLHNCHNHPRYLQIGSKSAICPYVDTFSNKFIRNHEQEKSMFSGAEWKIEHISGKQWKVTHISTKEATIFNREKAMWEWMKQKIKNEGCFEVLNFEIFLAMDEMKQAEINEDYFIQQYAEIAIYKFTQQGRNINSDYRTNSTNVGVFQQTGV